MNNVSPESLAELAVEALERIAFVLASPVEFDEASRNAFQPAVAFAISFAGLGEGRVVLLADASFAAELAAGFLGAEPEEVDVLTSGRDAVSELTNIVGGSVVLALGGDQQEYQYGLPEPFDRRNWTTACEDASVALLEGELGRLVVACQSTGVGDQRSAA